MFWWDTSCSTQGFSGQTDHLDMQMQRADINILFDSAQASNAVASALLDYFSFRKIPLKEYLTGGGLDAQ